MTKHYLTLSLLLATASAFAQNDSVVRWRQIVGTITAPGIDNPVAITKDGNGNITSAIHSAPGPWTAKEGSARINLATGAGSFEVEGLVLHGGNASGTPGAVNTVVGTLVCNPGTADQAILDTPTTALSPTGDAELSFRLALPSTCSSPLFLIRAGVRWIAAGAVRTTVRSSDY